MIKCAFCDGSLLEKKGVVEFDNRVLGKILVPGLEFLECEKCGDQFFTPEMSKKASQFILKKQQAAIDRLPVGEFVTAKEAAGILGITKQAFNKNKKIKAGLIYSVKKDNRRLYHKKSVELFKEKGNGKFLIPKRTNISTCQIMNYNKIILSIKPNCLEHFYIKTIKRFTCKRRLNHPVSITSDHTPFLIYKTPKGTRGPSYGRP